MTLHSVAAYKRFIASLPATEIVAQWGGYVAKVGGKVFAMLGEGGTPIVFKVTEISFDGLTSLDGIGQAPYFAKRAWVSIDKGAPLTDAELKAYIKASHGMIAMKLTRKLRAELGLD
jgi:predicted DNA-binding protein (MmcQ/YjbR family)